MFNNLIDRLHNQVVDTHEVNIHRRFKQRYNGEYL